MGFTGEPLHVQKRNEEAWKKEKHEEMNVAEMRHNGKYAVPIEDMRLFSNYTSFRVLCNGNIHGLTKWTF